MTDHHGWLDAHTFTTVIASTPLVSIDLLVENGKGEFLLGKRLNQPAKGYWFVPGGRVLKNESLNEAFRRITRDELGVILKRPQASFKGVYEHFYHDFVFGSSTSTHYIVLAFYLKIEKENLQICLQQHSQSRWVKPQKMHELNTHDCTLDYFR